MGHVPLRLLILIARRSFIFLHHLKAPHEEYKRINLSPHTLIKLFISSALNLSVSSHPFVMNAPKISRIKSFSLLRLVLSGRLECDLGIQDKLIIIKFSIAKLTVYLRNAICF